MQSDNQHGAGVSNSLNRELPFRVSDWLVDPQNNELQLGDNRIKLEPKVMDVLIYLAMHQGQVVSREELEEQVWAGRVVTYDALTATVVKLRKAFHSENQSEPIIKTVSKRGYCLTAPIHQTPADVPPPGTDARITEQSEMGDGTASAATDNQASALPARVRADKRTVLLSLAVLIVLSIGGVYLFLSRDVSMPGSQTTSTPQPQTSGTSDPEALLAFNAGWKKFNEETPAAYKVAIPMLQRAIVLDPDYGQARAALAAIYWKTWLLSWHIELGTSPLVHTMELTDAALQQAMQHPTALAYQVSSEMLYVNRRYDAAIEEARRAIALEPNNALGYAALANAQVFAGLPGEAKASIDTAMQLDPHRPSAFLFTLGLIHFNSERFDKAAVVLEQAVQSSPQNHLIYVPLIAAYGQLGEQEKIASLLQEVNRLRKTCQLPLLNVSSPVASFHDQAWAFKNAADLTRLQAGLRAAGLPEW